MAPSRALMLSRKRATSRVMSTKPSPEVSTDRVAVAIVSTRAVWMGDKSKATQPRSALVQHLLLRVCDRLDEPMPHPADEGHHAVEIGMDARRQHVVAVAHDRRLRHRTGRQLQAAREDVLLQRRVFTA